MLRGADRKANTWSIVACLSDVIELLLIPSHSLVMPSAV